MYNKTKRQYHRQQQNELLDFQTSNPFKFWQRIRNLGPRKAQNIPLETTDNDGNILTDTNTVLSKWRTDFMTLYNPQTHNELPQGNTTQGVFTRNMDEPFSLNEVQKVLLKAKIRKAEGPDGIPYEVLKNQASITVLTSLFNKCYLSGRVPSLWTTSYIKPIPKNTQSDQRNPTNYRGISLLCCIGKLYSSLINKRLLDYLERHNMLVDEQNGFRPKRACIDHIHSLVSIIRNRKITNKDTFVCFVDMSKAFDCVNRNKLLNLLSNNINVGTNMHHAIASLYRNTTARIQLNGYFTDPFDILSGVKQGDTLSTTLFAIYINTLATDIKKLNKGIDIDGQNVSLLLYADDIAIIAENEENLQTVLNCLNDWCKSWKMNINETKTKIIHFRKASKDKTSFKFNCGQKRIEVTEQYKYLGCTLNESLDLSNTARALSNAASRSLGANINKLKQIKGMHYKTYTELYNKCVCTISDYCSGVWGFQDFNAPKNLHHRAIRAYLGVHQYASNPAITGDMGWIPPVIRRRLDMIRLWFRLNKMHNHRLTKRIYIWDQQHRGNTWNNDIKSIFEETGNIAVYNGTITYPLKRLLEVIKQSLLEQSLQKWKNDTSSQPKLRTYISFKSDIYAEPYLLKYLPPHLRSVIAQFRCGILPIEIELGRYRGKSPEERLCPFCDEQIEDEIHFVFKCAKYDKLRDMILPTDTQTINPAMNIGLKLKELMDVHTKNFALYLYNALQIRLNALTI